MNNSSTEYWTGLTNSTTYGGYDYGHVGRFRSRPGQRAHVESFAARGGIRLGRRRGLHIPQLGEWSAEQQLQRDDTSQLRGGGRRRRHMGRPFRHELEYSYVIEFNLGLTSPPDSGYLRSSMYRRLPR